VRSFPGKETVGGEEMNFSDRKVVWKRNMKDWVLRIEDNVIWLSDIATYHSRTRIIGLKDYAGVYVLNSDTRELICAVREGGTIYDSPYSTAILYSDGGFEIEVTSS